MINRHTLSVLFLLIILVAVGQMAQTIYIPGIPLIAHELMVCEGSIQRLMAAYLLCYGGSQLIYGPVSDRIGRRPIILIGMAIFSIGTLLAMLSSSLLILTISCGIQGIGTGVGGVMARTLPRDICNSSTLRQINGLLNMGILISPLLAPLIGGLLVDCLGWRSCFMFLLLLSGSVGFLVWKRLPETRPICALESNRNFGFWFLLREKAFNHYLMMLVGGLSGIVAFEAISGVLLGNMGMTAREVSLLFILPLPFTFLGAWYAGRARKHFSNLMWRAVISCLVAGMLMWLPSWLGIMTLWTLLSPACLFFFGAGMLFPLATTGAMEPHPHLSGTAGALVGGLQNIGSGVVAAFSSLLSHNGQFTLGIITFIMSVMILICWLPLSKKMHH
ncbi:arabinose efflux permease family protein [secondary endosymbiont of Heteropsylla cubana]|uniref:Arabinose efflux permease family protein n=1 Tax=secondary endosymbiont of Heteropsylla cubana TaxID=134287 RepID=J3YTE0_9ENTR|nr:multidrug efflux MFS transporter EmrD [secondary endosymbiont of Heteropsylla cubana]AFP85718.1 arabinose efflux permease family protein [secondary endosymbiont of Heteropsylla cubana]